MLRSDDKVFKKYIDVFVNVINKIIVKEKGAMIKNLDCDIYIYSNSIPKEVDIISEFESLFDEHEKGFVPASINKNEYNDNLRSCTVFSLHPGLGDDKELILAKDKLNKKINKLVQKNILDFVNRTGIKVKEQEPWEIIRYSESQKLIWHSDNGESHPCQISFVVYLNDDYEGGEVEFKEFLPGRKIKPDAGSLLVFPSSVEYVHKVNPVKSGVKYALISFAK